MIAPQSLPPFRPARHVERARSATKRRTRRARRRDMTAFARVLAIAALVSLPVFGYVFLTARLTGLNYALGDAQARRAVLQAESMRLDDAISRLDSRERLSQIAARLKMHDPRRYAIVTLPAPEVKVEPHGVAFLGAVNDWFRTP